MNAEGDAVRLGLIGAGRWGRNHVRTIAGLEGVRLTRLASRNPESRALAGPGCVVDADWRAVIAAGDIDGVIVASPPALHAEMTTAAIERGLPVMVEKPMTLSVAEAEALAGLARARGAILRVDHVHLYSAAWRALKAEAAALGPLRAIESEGGDQGPFRGDAPMLWDWAPHDLAMCLDLVGAPPGHIEARRLERRAVEGGQGETVEAVLDFGGVAARVTVGNLFPSKRRRFVATFENGRLVYDDVDAVKLRRVASAAAGPGEAVALAAGRPLERAVRAFADAVRLGRPDDADARLGLEVVRLLARLDGILGGA